MIPSSSSVAAAAAAPVARLSSAPFAGDADRYTEFGRDIDALRDRIYPEAGVQDVQHIRRVDLISQVFQVAGRGLIHFSFGPVSFTLGVVFLWLYKQLQFTEIGHTVLHGTYDKLPGGAYYSAKTFVVQAPIDEESWRYGHNVRHHQATNVASKDPDIQLGPVRMTEQTPYHPIHRIQLPYLLVGLLPGFAFWMNTQFTGLIDLYLSSARPASYDLLPDRSPASRRRAWWRTLRKVAPHYFKNFVFFPALAGPHYAKVLLGNFLAGVLSNIYTAAAILCSHNGNGAASFPTGTRPRTHGEWCAMQVAATNNFAVSYPVSVLVGCLDKQIEHHLYPTLPPNLIRRIAPEVQAICARHGIEYRSASWGRTIVGVLKHVVQLSARAPRLDPAPPMSSAPDRRRQA